MQEMCEPMGSEVFNSQAVITYLKVHDPIMEHSEWRREHIAPRVNSYHTLRVPFPFCRNFLCLITNNGLCRVTALQGSE